MSSTSPSTSTSELSPIFGTATLSSSDQPILVKVPLVTMQKQLGAFRKSLVKRRRNELAAAARARKSEAPSGAAQWEAQAKATMKHLRKVDARMGLLKAATGPSGTYFYIDLRDPDLRDFGFGMDDNGNYPAL